MAITKPSFCHNCPINNYTQGYTPLKIRPGTTLVVGESSGEDEIKSGEGFSGGSGAWLKNMFKLAGQDWKNISTLNVLGCFVTPRALVLTPVGWQELGHLPEGTQVLTHNGRFRKVENIIRNPPRKTIVRKITLAIGDSITVTEDHQFYDGNTWVYAANLQPGKEIKRIAEVCIWCGGITNRKYKLQFRGLAFCSYSCHNRFAASKSSEALSASMKEQYLTGKRDRFQITKAANQAFRQLCQGGWRPKNIGTPEFRQIHRVKSAIARQAKGIQDHFYYIGYGEAQLADLLTASGFEYTPQFALNGCNFDFKVGDLLIEVDGPDSRNRIRQAADLAKEVLAKTNGYKVIHVPYTNVEAALSYLQNDEHEYIFSNSVITQVHSHPYFRPSWTLQVAEDESYIAQGVINHNCKPPDNIFPGDAAWRLTTKDIARAGIEYCKEHHLWPGVKKASKTKLFAIGGKSLEALTGRHGITTWRGSALPIIGETTLRVMPTIHPAALMRQAKLVSVVVGDLRKKLTLPPENYNLFPNLADVKRFTSKRFAFDFEWDRDGNITICGLSDRFYSAIVVPFVEPYITELRRIFESATHLIGHNIIGADLAHIEKLGWDISSAIIEDTMLKQHLIQPDMPHDLAFVASVFTNKVFWKGKGWEEVEENDEGFYAGQQWRTWDRKTALPRNLGGYGGCGSGSEAFALYNARDTDAEFQINTPLDQLLRKWGLQSIYENVSRPAGYICRWMGERGLRLDTSRLGELRSVIDTKISEMEVALPIGLKPFVETVSCNLPAPPETYKSKTKKCKGSKSLGNQHPVAIVTFTSPGVCACPDCGKSLDSGRMVLAKIVKGIREERVVPYTSPTQVQAYVDQLKLAEVLDHKTKRRTTGKAARGIWAKNHPEFVLLGDLKEQVTLRNNFAKDSLQNLDRMYFNLLVHGTSEGRLSSSGRRRGIDLNIQNQPEDFRVVYIPEREDWGFVNIDISQGESWLTCWLAKDWVRWEKLQDPSYDEHSELAQAFFNKPVNKQLAKIDKEIAALRQLGKKINHGRSYGMGANKQHADLISLGYDTFTIADVKEFIEIWKTLNPGTAQWQRETMEMASRQGYLINPFGRRRWFSHRDGTQALAFLPASSLADMVLRFMICHYPDQFMDAITINGQKVFHPIVQDWIMSIQVHDSLVLQGPWITRDEQIERSVAIMTQEFQELDGFSFRVDVKSSQKSWGECS